ncbi:MAG: lantibiotic dehydratase [Kofleriaceae bacterium]
MDKDRAEKPDPKYRPLPRFVLRTPTLPFDTLARWSAMSGTEERRAELARLVADPTVREALYLASPELDAQIPAWQKQPESQSGIAVERALVRYISRMASRSTPFGLFASVSVGSVGETTNLAIPPREAAKRHTRLDNDLLFQLCADLAKDRGIRAHLRYRPNSSLYSAAARLRYAEARLVGAARVYHLVAVDRTPYLEALLERARTGATLGELVDVLCTDPEITREEATAFLGEVIDTQILVPELAPAVTGREPTAGIIDSLRATGLDLVAEPLAEAERALADIDAAPSNAPERYKAIEQMLASRLPTKVEPSRLFQVDMFKTAAEFTISKGVAEELRRAAQLLHELSPGGVDGEWSDFRNRFNARYETREVPLLEVLDEESGIGFGETGDSPRAAPLLADLAFPGRSGPRRTNLATRDVYLMALVSRALQEGADEIVLTDEDVGKLTNPEPTPLADLIAMQCQLVAPSSDAFATGDYQIRVIGCGRGAALLGRFCHGSPEVSALTEECLRFEETAAPDAVYAEIVHLPEGRVGNILLRPVLREYEIPYLGASGADADKQIDVNDLTVSIVENRVVLKSKRLGREVIPRLTSAHNYTARSLAVYRFLCSHAGQNLGQAFWTWGIANEMPYLPRVRRGRVVLERARWTLLRKELATIEAAFGGLSSAKTPDQVRAVRQKVMAAVQAIRAKRKLPRWIIVGDHDNELPVDLDNELMVESAAHLLKSRTVANVFEMLPGPDQLAVRSPEGAFSHELIIMLNKDVRPVARPSEFAAPPVQRRFLPGSEWLYLKLYTGRATADALLRDYLAPAVKAIFERGLATHWFFIRYGDPDWHVRLRFAGDPAKLTGQVLPLLHEALAPASERGLVWKIMLDTYEREVERYGGDLAIDTAEHLFRADSDCVLSIIESLEGDAGADATWRLALRGIDRLMDDLGLSLVEKLVTMTVARDGFGAELGMDTNLQKALGEKFRKHRAEITSLLDTPADDPDHMFGPAFQMIAERSRVQAPLTAHLRELEAQGKLRSPILELAHSFIHMHVNRMIRSAARMHELVLYDLLRRHYDGMVARAKHKAS